MFLHEKKIDLTRINWLFGGKKQPSQVHKESRNQPTEGRLC